MIPFIQIPIDQQEHPPERSKYHTSRLLQPTINWQVKSNKHPKLCNKSVEIHFLHKRATHPTGFLVFSTKNIVGIRPLVPDKCILTTKFIKVRLYHV